MTDNPHVKKLQQELGLTADGILGPMTRAALAVAVTEGRVSVKPPITVITEPSLNESDDLEKLRGVHHVLQSIVREAYDRSPRKFQVSEGLRSKERQSYLLKIGASKTLDSRHLTGHAVDLWPLGPNGKPLPSDAAFPKGSKAAKDASNALWAALREIASLMKLIAKERGIALEWGGDWGWDAPHFQLNRAAYPA